MEAIRALPKEKQKRVKTSWEQITEEYFQEGMEKGMEIPVRQYLMRFPNASDEEVVALLGIPLELVKRVRASLGD